MNQIFYFLFTKSVGLFINLVSLVSLNKAAKLAYHFFTNPRDGKLNPKELPTILQKAKSQILKFQRHKIHTYIWPGNDNTILLVHGWESNASRWENLIPYLKKSGCTIVALDAPAHGLSSGTNFSVPRYANFIHQTVQHFKPKYIVGHSMGGKTCLYYQHLFPNDTIEKMVILGAPSDFTIYFYNYTKILSLSNRVIKELETRYINYYKQKLDEFASHKFVKTINAKGLIAHDINDNVVNITEGKKIASNWQTAQFIQTNGLGHTLHDDDLYNKVYDFLFEAETA